MGNATTCDADEPCDGVKTVLKDEHTVCGRSLAITLETLDLVMNGFLFINFQNVGSVIANTAMCSFTFVLERELHFLTDLLLTSFQW